MAKNKPPRKKGRRVSNSPSVPHAPYIRKFWGDYSDEEWHGLNLNFGSRKGQKGFSLSLFFIALFVVLAGAALLIMNMIR